MERAVLDMLLAGPYPQLATLREQLQILSIAHREYTGVGSFTRFAIPPSVPRADPERFQLTDVHVSLVGLEHGVGVVLFVSDGVLQELECFSLGGEEWPAEPQMRSISYLSERQVGPSTFELKPAQERDSAAVLRQLNR